MAVGLSVYARKLLVNEKALRSELVHPVLVWAAPPAESSEEILLGTASGASQRRPTSNEPLVYPVVKTPSKNNAFAMGVTVGRTENNDIALPDNSVSRFHAFLQQDARSKEWKVFDAESRNGTFVGALKLSKGSGVVLGDGERVKFGNVELRMFIPASLIAFLRG